MATYERSIGRPYALGQIHERMPAIEKIRARTGIIFERAKAIGRTLADAARNGLSVLPQPLAGMNPPVSVDEAIEAFITVGRVSLSHADSPKLPLGSRKKQFVAGHEMIVFEENTIATIVPLAEIQHGSPYIRD